MTASISLVVHGERNLPVTDIESLSGAVDMTLAGLLTAATPIDSIPKHLQAGYRHLLRGLRKSEALRADLAKRPPRKHRKAM